MPKKAKALVEKEEVVEEVKPKAKSGNDLYRAVGRRKRAIARVWLKLGKGAISVNGKPMEEYFASLKNSKQLEEPFRVVNRLGQMEGEIKVEGGGLVAQAGAVLHGISRALLAYDETMRSGLSKRKLLTRDSRVKERRKYGRAGKARARKQSPKR
ncbi:MAG TPA: 30S ribosomal protein S9 [Candidatus Nanoarchaeia archaeon]|nr:30S ribosomal protein S9 [uncultured archaeon]